MKFVCYPVCVLYLIFHVIISPHAPHCRLRLLADMQERGGASRIAEVVYDASIGLWGYLHLRKGEKALTVSSCNGLIG